MATVKRLNERDTGPFPGVAESPGRAMSLSFSVSRDRSPLTFSVPLPLVLCESISPPLTFTLSPRPRARFASRRRSRRCIFSHRGRAVTVQVCGGQRAGEYSARGRLDVLRKTRKYNGEEASEGPFAQHRRFPCDTARAL